MGHDRGSWMDGLPAARQAAAARVAKSSAPMAPAPVPAWVTAATVLGPSGSWATPRVRAAPAPVISRTTSLSMQADNPGLVSHLKYHYHAMRAIRARKKELQAETAELPERVPWKLRLRQIRYLPMRR